MDATGGGRNARLDNFRSAAVWTGRRKRTVKARGGQDKGQRAEMEQFVEAVRTGAPMPITPTRCSPPHGPPSRCGESLLSGRPERVRPAAGTSRLGWYARRLGRMSPAEIAWRAREQALRRPGTSARCARGRLPRCRRSPQWQRPGAGSPPSCRLSRAARVPEHAQGRDHRGRGPAAQGRVGDARRRPDRHGAARLVLRPGDGLPVRTGHVRVLGSTRATRHRSATSSRSGSSTGCST